MRHIEVHDSGRGSNRAQCNAERDFFQGPDGVDRGAKGFRESQRHPYLYIL